MEPLESDVARVVQTALMTWSGTARLCMVLAMLWFTAGTAQVDGRAARTTPTTWAGTARLCVVLLFAAGAGVMFVAGLRAFGRGW
ncbi:hypothetical protein GCM10023196_094960 [Actinoallomurus vinaceus]|uniref:Uncharacterized protein n=1 Tax=Actinoallomurus vinaceus TaxID=1080074 RepID=A0ABP8URL5_9ACTN